MSTDMSTDMNTDMNTENETVAVSNSNSGSNPEGDRQQRIADLEIALRLCASRAGVADPLEACRLVIDTVNDALAGTEPGLKRFDIRILPVNDLQGFAAYLAGEEVDPVPEIHVNFVAHLYACKDHPDINWKEFLAESILHELMHLIQHQLGLELSELEIEASIDRARKLDEDEAPNNAPSALFLESAPTLDSAIDPIAHIAFLEQELQKRDETIAALQEDAKIGREVLAGVEHLGGLELARAVVVSTRFLIGHCYDLNAGNTELKMREMTRQGEPIGDWEVIVRRTDDDDSNDDEDDDGDEDEEESDNE